MAKSIEQLEMEVQTAWDAIPQTNINAILRFERTEDWRKAKKALANALRQATK